MSTKGANILPLNNFGRVHASLVKVLRSLPGGGQMLDVPRYRLTWQPRAVRNTVNDYTSLSNLMHAVENPADPGYTANVESLADIEQWMRVLALERIVRNWDSYGYANGHNMYAYKPTAGRWQLHIVDVDYAFSIGGTNTTDLFEDYGVEPRVSAMLGHPPFRRAFWRAVQDAVNGPMLEANINPVFDANCAALQANGINAVSPGVTNKAWVQGRRNYLLNLSDFSPDAKLLATASGGVIQFWRVADGALMVTYDSDPVGPNTTVDISPDGKLFAYGGGELVVARMPALITETQRVGNVSVVCWQGGTGLYQLQMRTHLNEGAWQDLGNATTNTCATNTVVATNAFFRVLSLPHP